MILAHIFLLFYQALVLSYTPQFSFINSYNLVTPTPQVLAAQDKAVQIGAVTYAKTFTQDNYMAVPQDVFLALNKYRLKKNRKPLLWNDALAQFAQQRAGFIMAQSKLDQHSGFYRFIREEKGFQKLGFNHLGENTALAGPLTGEHLIENIFSADPQHDANQVDPSWTHVGIGVAGITTVIIFGGEKRK